MFLENCQKCASMGRTSDGKWYEQRSCPTCRQVMLVCEKHRRSITPHKQCKTSGRPNQLLAPKYGDWPVNSRSDSDFHNRIGRKRPLDLTPQQELNNVCRGKMSINALKAIREYREACEKVREALRQPRMTFTINCNEIQAARILFGIQPTEEIKQEPTDVTGQCEKCHQLGIKKRPDSYVLRKCPICTASVWTCDKHIRASTPHAGCHIGELSDRQLIAPEGLANTSPIPNNL